MLNLRQFLRLSIAIMLVMAFACSELVAAFGPESAPAQNQPQPDWAAPHVGTQLLVKLPITSNGKSESLEEQERDFRYATAVARLAAAGARIRRTVPQLGLALVESPGEGDLATAATDLIGRGLAEWAEPNYTFDLDLVPNDPYYAAVQAPYLGRLEMPAAWDLTVGRPEIVIAILDTGVDMTHPDLSAGIWTNPGEVPGNGVDDDRNGFVDDVHGWNFPDNNNQIYDDYSHGTHVAGIAAARANNGIGIAGMAGKATIMPVDVFPSSGFGTYADLIQALVYATDNGARVINMSLGATSYSRGEEAAVDYAWAHGAVVVAAAGNSGRESYHYPAAHPHAIAVAATDPYDNLAGFSTWGDFVDLAAPGVGVYSTVPNNRYSRMSGTSMATPHVAGLAGLVLSLNANLTPDAVRALLEENADDLGAAGWDPHYGHGRINGRKALAAVPIDPTLPSPTPHPPLVIWPEGCRELIADGDFESGLESWQATGDVLVDGTRAYTGTYAAHFPGGPDSTGTLTRTFSLPPAPKGATLWFVYRIENQDQGWGSDPQAPYDDWFTAELRTADGQLLSTLLRTGNSADTASAGLPWDRYLYRLEPAAPSTSSGQVLTPLLAAGQVALVFRAGNDSDALPTDFWVDQVRLCVEGGYGLIFPIMLKEAGLQ
jgi:hypothetical protein